MDNFSVGRVVESIVNFGVGSGGGEEMIEVCFIGTIIGVVTLV